MKRQRFKLFRIALTIIEILILIILCCFMINAFLKDSLGQFILYVIGEIFVIIGMAVSTDYIVKMDKKLYPEKYTDISNTKREGLWGEIWHTIENISKIDNVKVEFLDKINNTIDMVVVRDNHEFGFVIDEGTLSVVVDEEEADNPIEVKIKLSEISNIEEFWRILTEFIEQNS